ncbi:glycine/betaine ABC transporter substrate-binding protein [Geodermatophilus sp. TF02-6]|uniref:ABC transporter substrate-binding protein n=1 Tax=Geodermatophilus sp. TF02-6 TaxID=2250575 RepID=UPI000DE8B8A1|nr:ABC transporter substrate-binding protein [Geodermatophilus sp. TF02-6]RBY78142.1 glycine/betaine ABC transporter substrate-binding protein [Geodermatophilus sp. TF02-6]
MRRPRVVPALLLLLGVLLLPGCGSAPAPQADDGAIRFASYDFVENQVLAEVYAEGVRRAGLPVSVQHGIGTREVVLPALEQGVVDVVVDYLGTALDFVDPGRPTAPGQPQDLHAALAGVLGPREVSVLDAAPAEDQNGFVVRAAFAEQHGVHRLSDLAPIAAGLAFGGPPECPERRYCLPGLRDVYGLRFAAVRPMPSRAATVEALLSGEVDVGLLETTDARLADAPLVLLDDDRSLQPHENVVPFVRTAVLDRAGQQLRTALDAVSARLTDADLVRLNRLVVLDGRTPAQAAALWWDGR